METLYWVIGLVMLGAVIHVIVKIKTINETINSIFAYSKELRGSDEFTMIGVILPHMYSYVVYVYGYIFGIAILVSSAIALVLMSVGWFIWFYSNIIALIIIKDATWTVPHYMWGKEVKPKAVEKELRPYDKLILRFSYKDERLYDAAVEAYNEVNPTNDLIVLYDDGNLNGAIYAKVESERIAGIINDTVVKLKDHYVTKSSRIKASDINPFDVKDEVYYYQDFSEDICDSYSKVIKSARYNDWLVNDYLKDEYYYTHILVTVVGNVINKDAIKNERITGYIKADAYLANILNIDITDI